MFHSFKVYQKTADAKRRSFDKLKPKYESVIDVDYETPKIFKTPKILKKSKVKQIASRFKSKITQIVKRYKKVGKYTTENLSNQIESSFRTTHKVDSSQFWITSGNFTATIPIHHCEADKLMILSSICAQETRELSFGIDEHMFSLDNSAIPDNILKRLPQKNNYSQYWFSTPYFLIPFTGTKLTSQKIQSFFNYIREFMDDEGIFRFGIDDFDFSNDHQHGVQFWGTDLALLEYEQRLIFLP